MASTNESSPTDPKPRKNHLELDQWKGSINGMTVHWLTKAREQLQENAERYNCTVEDLKVATERLAYKSALYQNQRQVNILYVLLTPR